MTVEESQETSPKWLDTPTGNPHTGDMTTIQTTAPDPIETVLYDHREDVVCFEHPPGDAEGHPSSWCCICGDHEITVTQRAHVAAALRTAGYYRDGEERP